MAGTTWDIVELRSLVQQLRRDKDLLTNTIRIRAVAKVLADEAKAIAIEAKGVAAQEKASAEKAKTVAVAAKLVADVAKAVAAQEKVIADQSTAIAVTAKVAAAEEKRIADQTKAIAKAAKVVADEAKLAAAEEKVVADEAKAIAVAAKVVADEAKAVAAQEKVIADETKAIAMAAKVVADEAKAIAAQEKVIADEAKALAAEEKAVADEAKAIAAQEKIIADEAKALAVDAKVIADEAKAVTAQESKQDRAWSTSFQRALLPPRLPTIAGCRFDAIYEPGESDAHVGGDWYDAVRLMDGRVLISIGDVAGSGHEAAVLMGVVRQIMRGIAQLHADPALMLDAADRALRLEHPDVFATTWVGVVDLISRSLTYASAGHPPTLLASTSGIVSELSDRALPLGLRQSNHETASTVALTEGSTLVLYTDGLTEAARDIVAGDVLVHAAAAQAATAPWGRLAGDIQRHALATGPSSDDVAILVVRFDFAQAENHIQRLPFDVRDPDAARRARGVLRARLSARGFPSIEKLNAELVFSELIANVLLHSVETGVEVAIDCSGPQTILHVLDRGLGFRHLGRLPSDLYCESGRGLFMIREMTDDFTVTERPGGGSHARAVLIGRLPRALQGKDVKTGTALVPTISKQSMAVP
jgi:serine phosphatase RsbU (regulator of sigma subunit)/anti-sigma regulatory factor (Ser/Thr protein kinase)